MSDADNDGDTRTTAAEFETARPSTLDPLSRLRVLKTWFRDDSAHSAEWRTHAKKDFDFKAGHQWEPEEKSQLNEEMRPEIVFNRSLAFIKVVAGFEINGRHETIFLPRNIENTAVNELLTGASKWMADDCDAEDEESEAFQDTLTCGMGWCLSGDAMVRLPRSHFATTRLYSGSVITIELENGKQLTGTPNHPVLTDRGWKRLCALKEGDNLVSSAFLQRVNGLPVEQFDKVESRLEDKIDAFRAGCEAAHFVTAPDDFYADGAGSEVHTIYANSLLLDQISQAASCKQVQKYALARRHIFSCLGPCFASLSLIFHALSSSVSHVTFEIAHLLRSQVYRFPLGPKLVTSAAQPTRYSLAGDFIGADGLCDLKGGHSFVEVHGRNFRNRNLRTFISAAVAQRISSPDQPYSDRGLRYSDYILDFFDWKPLLEIEAHKLAGDNAALGLYTTRVVARSSRKVADFPVHDVGTSLGIFLAGDVITSNTECKISYEQDAAGLYDQPQVNPLEMYWDYRARKRNLVDCKRIARLRTLPVGDAKEMFPGKDVEELDAKWALGLEPEEQTKTLEEKRIREENAGDNYVEKYEVHIVQMQWSERVPYWLVADPQENTKITLSDAKYKVLKERMDSLGIPLIAVKIFKREFFQSFLGRDELEFNNAPIPDRFSFECITGEQDRNKGTWFGLIRMLRDPQKWANKWLSQTLHIMNANAKGGIMAEPDAFDDQRQAEESYARPEAITWMKKGALSASNPKWVKKPVADFPNGFFQLMEFAISSLPSVVGINLEILGQKDIMQPGVLEAQRKQAAMTVLATMFDSLRRFRKRVGRIRLYYIQNYLSDGRLIRIAGQEGAKVVPLLKDKCLGEYDVVVDDAPTSPNQKQANWALIAPLLPAFKDQLVANPQMLLAILEYSPLPSRLVEQMRLVLAQPNPQQQAQQQMQQLGLAALIARINKDQSTAEMQNAKAGATQATAMYDLAMARNLLQKNGFDQVASHLDALQKIADITKTSAETEHAKAKTGGQHLSNLIDALTPIPAAPQAQAQQVQDQQAA